MTIIGAGRMGRGIGTRLVADVGPLRRARELEHLGFLHISLQGRLGTEFRSAVKFLW
ncbi:MAG: hypothetical protein ACRDSP_04205 [Pseudonocardiaceae bacterium]